ncbi:Uncharacterised protein [Mycobacteroides abscessus subsp. abscessus]|nr:Uncharacterised protein [Mycobacteroides abscessus subsp. abscessus]
MSIVVSSGKFSLIILRASGVSICLCTKRFNGLAPNCGSYASSPNHALASSDTLIEIRCAINLIFNSVNILSTIELISLIVNGLNNTISSIRLIISGLKYWFKLFITAFSVSSVITPASFTFSNRICEPMLLVIMIIVFLKSTSRPLESVSLPSSSICNNTLNTSECAFSISSNNITEYGLRRTASVNCPPSS